MANTKLDKEFVKVFSQVLKREQEYDEVFTKYFQSMIDLRDLIKTILEESFPNLLLYVDVYNGFPMVHFLTEDMSRIKNYYLVVSRQSDEFYYIDDCFPEELSSYLRNVNVVVNTDEANSITEKLKSIKLSYLMKLK
ncbi:MAG: hypothetical protein QXD23_04005 [Candidatus Micrarchaeaceae archaeon]